MFLTYYQSGGLTYARCDVSHWVNGKAVKEYTNLGRVLDRERHIFRNRERGDFTFDPLTGQYGPVPADFTSPPRVRRRSFLKIGRKKVSRLVLRFGDTFLFNEFFNTLRGLKLAVEAIPFSNHDTLLALLCFYVTSAEANCFAEDWFELNYARVLWPKANMASQKISEALAEIGLEESKRAFFAKYYEFLRSVQMHDTKSDFGILQPGEIGGGILIDSTGLPNEAKLPSTGLNNHNGQISLEARIIYVVQQSTGLPLFYRYVPGNVIDASTLKRTIAEVKAMHIDTKFALLDAGYYNGINADTLSDAKISFVTRVHGNNRIFIDAFEKYRTSIEHQDNLVGYNGRLYFIQEVPVMIGTKGDCKAYGYLCLDTSMKAENLRTLSQQAVIGGMTNEATFALMQRSGMFMLVATRQIRKDKILQLYYTRNQVEEIFKIGKKEGKMLPLGIESDATLRGHLMMTFITSTIMKILQDKLEGSIYRASNVFSILHDQSATMYEHELITSEPIKKMNEIYKVFKITCPSSLPYQPTASELARLYVQLACGNYG